MAVVVVVVKCGGVEVWRASATCRGGDVGVRGAVLGTGVVYYWIILAYRTTLLFFFLVCSRAMNNFRLIYFFRPLRNGYLTFNIFKFLDMIYFISQSFTVCMFILVDLYKETLSFSRMQ